jgi:hypothetical protein
LACLDDAEQVSLSVGLKRSALVDASGDGGHLGHMAVDAGPGTVWHRVAALRGYPFFGPCEWQFEQLLSLVAF